MEFPVLVERLGDGRYAARCGFGLSAEGPTAHHARANLQREVDRILSHGGQIMTIVVPDPPAEHPSARMIGTLDLNDPMVQEWQRLIREHRAELDREMNEQP